MDTFIIFRLTFLLTLITSTMSWQFFTSLSDFTLSTSEKDTEVVHSEYFFGKCKDLNKVLYAHIHIDHIEVLGKIIMRGWLNIWRIPTCIILKGTSYEEDTFRSTSYNFQMCVPRITYCHSKHRFKYYYYEWYIPEDLVGGMNWDIYFFGPPTPAW